MLLDFYNLRSQPFGVTPDPSTLYLGPTHREALASLTYGIQSGRGFLALLAQPGMGKTTLLFQLLQQLRGSSRTVFVFQTQCDSRELLRYILAELDIDVSGAWDLVRVHDEINQLLLREARTGRNVVLIIDEAQNLTESVLETVRLLSDFETPQRKLLQIILAGQPQLAEKLSSPALVQLRQRISIICRLMPFDTQETSRYIDHRLHLAGNRNRALFTPAARAMIADCAHGIPRQINNICFNALSLGYALGTTEIGRDIISEVISDLDLEPLRPEFEPPQSIVGAVRRDAAHASASVLPVAANADERDVTPMPAVAVAQASRQPSQAEAAGPVAVPLPASPRQAVMTTALAPAESSHPVQSVSASAVAEGAAVVATQPRPAPPVTLVTSAPIATQEPAASAKTQAAKDPAAKGKDRGFATPQPSFAVRNARPRSSSGARLLWVLGGIVLATAIGVAARFGADQHWFWSLRANASALRAALLPPGTRASGASDPPVLSVEGIKSPAPGKSSPHKPVAPAAASNTIQFETADNPRRTAALRIQRSPDLSPDSTNGTRAVPAAKLSLPKHLRAVRESSPSRVSSARDATAPAIRPGKSVSTRSGVRTASAGLASTPIPASVSAKTEPSSTRSNYVVVSATIGTDGRIKNIHAVSGNTSLLGSAIAVVQRWRYEPVYLNGRPVEVETRITVNFSPMMP